MTLEKNILSVVTPAPPSASVPDGLCVYAIGDIHGKLDLLVDLMDKIRADAARYPDAQKILIFLGDYIDRGPDSAGVIDYLLHDRPKDFESVFLRGNHEDYALKFLQGDLAAGMRWMQFGGAATLASYGVNPFRAGIAGKIQTVQSALVEKMPPDHRDFLAATVMSHSCGNYYFVHAGVRPSLGLDHQNDIDRLWIREEFLASRCDFGKIVIHGHSIAEAPDVQVNRIGIDTGAYATGRLTALRLHRADRHFLHT